MITSDNTSFPVIHWLHFLRDLGMNTRTITIDCSIPEVNAISSAFDQVTIRYCFFHVHKKTQRFSGSKEKGR
jgi:hypothetical protein